MPDQPQQPDFSTRTTPLDGIVDMAKPSQPKVDWAALNLVATQALAQAEVQAQGQATIAPPPQTWGQWGINQGARVGGGVIGGAVGSLAGPVGTLAGIATGAAIGDDWAQGQEVQQGVRQQRNPLETFVAALTAPLPGGTIARGTRLLPAIGKALLTAQPANLVGSLAMQGAEGNGVSLGRTARDMAGATAIGTGIGVGLRGAQAAPRVATRVAQSPAVQHLVTNEVGAVGRRPAVPVDVAIANAKTLYMQRGAGQSPARMAQALRESGYREAASDHGLVAKFIAEAEGLPAPPPRTAPTRPVSRARRIMSAPAHNPFAVPEGVEPIHWDLDGNIVKETVAPDPQVPSGRAGALARFFSDETGAVGPDIRQAMRPDKPLDPTNLPETIEPRRDLQPAQVQEDIARTTRRNVEFLGMDMDTAQALAVRSASPEAQVQKRRIMPVTEMQAKANQIEAVIPAKGKTVNAEQQLALADHVKSLADDVDALNTRIGDVNVLKAGVLKGDPEAQAKVAELSAELGVSGVDGIERAQLERFDELAKWQLADEAVGSEWGRAGRARQVLAKHRQLDDVEFLKRAYEMGLPSPDAIKALSEMRGDPAAQRQFLLDLYKPTGQEYWKSYLAFNMLSGPPTMGVNLVSNALQYARKELASMQAAGMDRATAKGGTRVKMLPPKDLIVQSYADGMRYAGKALLHTMKTGVTPLETTSVYDGGREVFRGSWIAKALQASGMEEKLSKEIGVGSVNIIKRTLAGTDAAFQMMGIYPEAYRKATADAWNAGLRGEELAAGIQERIRNIDLGSEGSESIRKYAREVTFSDTPGEGSRKVQQLVNWVDSLTVKLSDKAWMARSGMDKDTFKSGTHYGGLQVPLGYMHMPFVRIAGNLFKESVRAVAGDAAIGSFNAGAKRGDRGDTLQRLAQASQTYALAGVIASLYESGVIDFTARAPENEYEREQFYGPQGKTPWAIGINGHYIPLTTLGSFGMAMAPLGLYLNAMKHGDADTPMKFTEAAAALGKVELDATFVRGAMTAFEGLSDERKQGKYLGNVVAQFTPAGAAGRNFRDLVDPVVRDPGGIGAERRFAGRPVASYFGDVIEEVEAQVPGLSTRVRPRLNAYGQEIKRQGIGKRITGSVSTGKDYIGEQLLALKESIPDIARQNEGIYPAELKGAVASFEKTVEGQVNEGVTDPADNVKVRFTDAERQLYMRLVGSATHEALSEVITPGNAEWTSLSPKDKRAMVKDLKKIGKEIGEELFLEEWLKETPQ
jgi:hypothetical protein